MRIIIDVHDECTGDVYACYRSGVCVDKKGLTDTSPETVRYIIMFEYKTNRLTLERIN
jgi:hypothetical protein